MSEGKLIWQTLHCHTLNSDGGLTHGQVLDVCAQNGIGVVAFTDHDTLPSQSQVKKLLSLKDHPVKYVIGIEISSGYPKEIDELEPRLFHIVGLFVDPFNRDLLAYSGSIKRLKRLRLRRRIKEFVERGFSVSEKEVWATVAKNGRPTTLNLVNVLLSHRRNRLLLNKYVGEFRRLGQNNSAVRRLAQEMFQDDRGDKQKYFNIFFNDASPFKVRLPPEKLLEMDKAVELIRNAGGLAVLAHWTFDRENLKPVILERLVREKRLDGVETVYDLFLKDKPLWRKRIETDRRFLKSLVSKYNIFESGGVDAHQKEDFELFDQESSYAQATVGLVEKILRLKSPNLANSSLAN